MFKKNGGGKGGISHDTWLKIYASADQKIDDFGVLHEQLATVFPLSGPGFTRELHCNNSAS